MEITRKATVSATEATVAIANTDAPVAEAADICDGAESLMPLASAAFADGTASSLRGLKRRLSCSPSGRQLPTPQRQPASPADDEKQAADPECKECAPEVALVPPRSSKRTDYLSWDDYFMALAHLSAMRSKDPSTQVGACIVNPQNRIVGVGYNGFPAGCGDDELPWAREAASPLDTKYMYVCHAEMNLS